MPEVTLLTLAYNTYWVFSHFYSQTYLDKFEKANKCKRNIKASIQYIKKIKRTNKENFISQST